MREIDYFRFMERIWARPKRAGLKLAPRSCPIHQGENRTKPNPISKAIPLQTKRQIHGGPLGEVKETMLAKGRCCHQVEYISKRYDLETLSYLAKIDVIDHRQVDHEQCSRHPSCVAYNTNVARYKIQHAAPNCSCGMISTPSEDLNNLINSGKTPLISIENGTDTVAQPQLRVIPHSEDSRYIAISHVSGDGFGNPNQNALPWCQIRRLAILLQAMQTPFENREVSVCFLLGINCLGPISLFIQSPKLLLWMDTLCIPADPKDTSLRLSQINNMASIYENALSSLVLDAELMATVVDPVRISAEARARIACSLWMWRGWTCLEGRLPPKLTIAFNNTLAVMGGSCWGSYTESLYPYQPSERRYICRQDVEANLTYGPNISRTRSSESSLIRCVCVDITLQKSFHRAYFSKVDYEFAEAWNQLSGRIITNAHHTPFIIANMIGFDIRPLLRYRKSHEMFQEILLSLDMVTFSFFFTSAPRQDENGNHQNRWIPRDIGADMLTAEMGLRIHTSHLSYRYYPDDKNLSIYCMGGVVSLKTKLYFHCATNNTTYVVDAAMSVADEMDAGDFSATYIIIEKTRVPGRDVKQRGACFYLQSTKSASSRFSRPTLELTYICPIQLEEVQIRDRLPQEKDGYHTGVLFTAACELRIRYGTYPYPVMRPTL